MEEHPLPAAKAASRLADAYLQDQQFKEGRVLGSMYTTPHPAGLAAYRSFVESNLGNAGLYPGTADLEQELLGWMGKLVNLPGQGLITSGGSEANLIALWAARESNPGKHKVLYGANAHFSLAKAIQILGLQGQVLPLNTNFQLDLQALEEALDDRVLAVVAQAGSTELGLCDDLSGLATISEGHAAHLHVDAAFGGFVLPFLKGEPYWAHLGRNASSLAIDPHKMGRAPVPAGSLLVRDEALLERISQQAPYLTRQKHVGILGTRCSAGVAAAWSTVAAMGRAGYRHQARECLANTHYLVERLAGLGLEPVTTVQTNVISFEVHDATVMKERLVAKGWYPSRMASREALRIVVMPHVTRKVIDRFIKALGESLPAD